jgi:hypothetical protein
LAEPNAKLANTEADTNSKRTEENETEENEEALRRSRERAMQRQYTGRAKAP